MSGIFSLIIMRLRLLNILNTRYVYVQISCDTDEEIRSGTPRYDYIKKDQIQMHALNVNNLMKVSNIECKLQHWSEMTLNY